MAPYNEAKRASLADHDENVKLTPQAEPREYTLDYFLILVLTYVHIGALYGLYVCFTSAKWATILYNFLLYILAIFGNTAGVHRLWSHRAYKAKLPLQILLMLCQTMTCQRTAFTWIRDHRLHHKYCDTDADPHNSTRGVFYSHIGWVMVKKHPEVIKMESTIDMSDIEKNPVLQFQKKYYPILVILMTIVQSVLIPVVFWQESILNAHCVALVSLVSALNVTFSINSIAHAFGAKPYDKTISPRQNTFLSLLTLGEGYHNYHHVFPFDYRVSEFGNNYLNFTTNFIDFFAWIGWAYDLKYASDDMIVKRTNRTGDGTDLWGQLKDK